MTYCFVLIGKESFGQVIATGVKALVKCVGSGAMKVCEQILWDTVVLELILI